MQCECVCLGASWHSSWKGSCKGCACTLGACKGRRMLTEGLKEEQGLNLCMGTAPRGQLAPTMAQLGASCPMAGCCRVHRTTPWHTRSLVGLHSKL